ncbi:MAG: hypothetical protein RL497_1087 [Pseudomonadota bacterium]|jgi:hypothetical protein
MNKKINIKYQKERVILSDVLPFEVPITFSNRYFYDFLVRNRIDYSSNNISWRASGSATDTVIKLLFGIDKPTKSITKQVGLKSIVFNSFDNFEPKKNMASVPFGYNISHQENRFRELTIAHPRNQLQMVSLYDEYKELILYHCNISKFSIRRPSRIARYVNYQDKTHFNLLSEDAGAVEEIDSEYRNLRSFFVYEDYSNIHKFYESHKYHRCEKKYNKLLKIDVAKCFDSIYTHSLAWALMTKDSVKQQLIKAPSVIEKTFGGVFDRLMQQINYNETNGIIIGPEFSRIFAELILQSVDRDVFLSLKSVKLIRGRDYELFRYVDDYFVFYNEDATKDCILKDLQIALKVYKLYLNPAKELIYEKPIITEITIAKNKISKLLNERLKYEMKEEFEADDLGEQVKIKIGSIRISANHLITDFKTVIRESGVKYKDILNYTLAVIEGQCRNILKNYLSIAKNNNSQKEFVRAILDIVEFIFFVYSVSPRVNTTLKLCRILHLLIEFFKSNSVDYDCRHIVFKLIFDDICFLLKKNKNTQYTQVETLYFLVALSELGKDYWLDQSLLCQYFGINDQEANYNVGIDLNYFSITVLLFYMKNKKRYSVLRLTIINYIVGLFEKNKLTLKRNTELTLLLFDSLTCPYIGTDIKRKLLDIYGVVDIALQDSVINSNQYWFTKWTNFDFGKELDAKRSQEVY